MTTVVLLGCRRCDRARRGHGARWHSSVGRHTHTRPTATQFAARLRARARARYAADLAARRIPVGERVLCVGLLVLLPAVAALVGHTVMIAAGGWS